MYVYYAGPASAKIRSTVTNQRSCSGQAHTPSLPDEPTVHCSLYSETAKLQTTAVVEVIISFQTILLYVYIKWQIE